MTPPVPGTARYIITLSLMHSLPNTTVGETRNAIEHVHAALVRHGFLAPDEVNEAESYESTWVHKRPSKWTDEERAWVRHIVFGAALDSEDAQPPAT